MGRGGLREAVSRGRWCYVLQPCSARMALMCPGCGIRSFFVFFLRILPAAMFCVCVMRCMGPVPVEIRVSVRAIFVSLTYCDPRVVQASNYMTGQSHGVFCSRLRRTTGNGGEEFE